MKMPIACVFSKCYYVIERGVRDGRRGAGRKKCNVCGFRSLKYTAPKLPYFELISVDIFHNHSYTSKMNTGKYLLRGAEQMHLT